ncbi:helix-turn-helix domain-containing protein [Moraxella lacunata]|uniref:helix-turn-helix domain-containing protein n=1 Tax=Moraxella lacunata TaxID=477 RepID=UPI003EE41ADC
MANATKRALQVIKALQGKTFSGVSVSELATALKTSSSNICRDLDDLVSEGFAEKRTDGRYQLSISLLQIAKSHQSETERLQERINEYNQRISRF